MKGIYNFACFVYLNFSITIEMSELRFLSNFDAKLENRKNKTEKQKNHTVAKTPKSPTPLIHR